MSKVISRRQGRPANAEASVRISPRFPEDIAERLRHASALQGVSVTSFVIDASRKAAERVIDQEQRWKLDGGETATLAGLLAKPPAVNSAARKAEALAQDVEIRS